MRVLVLGGAGFIGSHTRMAFAECARCDIRDTERLHWLMADNGTEAVIQLVALKAVSERMDDPLSYFDKGWTAEHGIERICKDAWRWQQENPHGYG